MKDNFQKNAELIRRALPPEPPEKNWLAEEVCGQCGEILCTCDGEI